MKRREFSPESGQADLIVEEQNAEVRKFAEARGWTVDGLDVEPAGSIKDEDDDTQHNDTQHAPA
ncbi:MAG TPA: hypothetical protein VGP82_16325 [Ktedonobacterales bacterium]|jgi:hypothetical protein|nr:hypothetical protein [Ktedonobacterales bacterium]